MGAGTETDEEVSVPKTIGVPMTPGMKLGMYVAWHNDTGKDLDGVYLKLTMLWTPKNQNPRPVNSLPIYMDVNLTVGGSNTFDVPPGKSTKSYEFTLPVGGRLLGVGGHMHDYGVGVRLEDAETGKVITSVVATRDAQGKVTKISRQAVRGERRGPQAQGQPQVPGRRRLRQSDQRDQGQGRDGAHGRPVRARRHEQVAQDRPAAIPTYQRDLASLQVRGRRPGRSMVATGHGGMQMDTARWTMARCRREAERKGAIGRRTHGSSRSRSIRSP